VTGWSIGELGGDGGTNTEVDSLYYKLAEVILPLYYNAPEKFAHVMRSAVAFNGSFFNTQRMMFQYLRNAYLPGWTKAQTSLL
jgi:starch phosphorylase